MPFDKTKTDSELGKRIESVLIKAGVNTPVNSCYFVENKQHTLVQSDNQKIDLISEYFRNIMTVLGLDIRDDSLVKTPERVAKMFVNEIFWGLQSENFPKCTAVDNKMNYDEMVILKNAKVQSFCEHHWVSITGKATVAYIPKAKVLGLSKINRVVEYFSRRPQIQERLTEQIYHALVYILGTEDVAVLIDAEHFCVSARGVEDGESRTVTSRLGGRFKDEDHPAARAEFMNIATSRG